MIGIAGGVAGVAVLDFAGSVREAVPDGLAFAVFVPRAFDLIGGSGCAPEKTLGEQDLGGRIELFRVRAGGGGRGRGAFSIRHTTAGEQSGGQGGCDAGSESGVGEVAAGQTQSEMRLLDFVRATERTF